MWAPGCWVQESRGVFEGGGARTREELVEHEKELRVGGGGERFQERG